MTLSESEMAQLKAEIKEQMLAELKQWMADRDEQNLNKYKELKEKTSSPMAWDKAYGFIYAERKALNAAYNHLQEVL